MSLPTRQQVRACALLGRSRELFERIKRRTDQAPDDARGFHASAKQVTELAELVEDLADLVSDLAMRGPT